MNYNMSTVFEGSHYSKMVDIIAKKLGHRDGRVLQIAVTLPIRTEHEGP